MKSILSLDQATTALRNLIPQLRMAPAAAGPPILSRAWRCWQTVLTGLALLALTSGAWAVSPNIVISQIYGGGGMAGATWRNDYIELFNRSACSVDVAGWSVQFAPAGSGVGFPWAVTPLIGSTVIPAGGYFLVYEASGGGGGALLPVAANTAGAIDLAFDSGKVALVNNTVALVGTGCPFAASVVDFVGYGAGTTCSEFASAPILTVTTADYRGGAGCSDTDQNNVDFASAAPVPRNSGTAPAPCGGPPSQPMTFVDDGYIGLPSGTPVAFPYPGAPGGTHTIGCDAFATIQGGVNAVINGGTVNVAPGNYVEQVVIGRPMTLLGAKAGLDARTTCRVGPARGIGGESVVDGNAVSAPFQITASGVTIDGFLIKGGQNSLQTGVWILNTTANNRILNNIITDNTIGLFPQCTGPLPTIVQRNLIDSNNRPGGSGGSGIYVERSSNLQIVENEIQGHINNNPIIIAQGVAGATVTHTNLLIDGNNIHDNACGCSAVYALAIVGGNISRNQFSAAGSGIYLGGNNRSVNVVSNFFTLGTAGVRLRDDGNFFPTPTPNTNIHINANSFGLGVTVGVARDASGTAGPSVSELILDASANWWGSALPSGAGSVPTRFSNGEVLTSIDYTPWLVNAAEPVPNPCDGFQGDFSLLLVDAASPQSTPLLGRIQEGINLGTGTVRIVGGTYGPPESADATAINKAITLAPGASPGQVTINGNMILTVNDAIQFELNGITPGSGYDQFIVNGGVDLGNAALSLVAGTIFPDCTILTNILNDLADPIANSFGGLPNGSLVTSSGSVQNFRIFYNRGDGNDMVLVKDTTGPALTCPSPNVTTNTTAGCSQTTFFTVTALDNCTPSTITCTTGTVALASVCVPAGNSTTCTMNGVFPVGSTPVTCTSTDTNLNTNTCTFNVIVSDSIPPVITCNPGVTNSAVPGQCSNVVTYANSTATDNCNPNPTVNCTPPSGSMFPVGQSTVTCIASDGALTSTCTFTVTVREFFTPMIMCPPDRMVFCPFDPSATNFFSEGGSFMENCTNAAVTISSNDHAIVEVATNQFNGWSTNRTLTGNSEFVEGPGTPPIPTGSLHLTVGSQGSATAELRNGDYNGTFLTNLTEMNYFAYRTTAGVVGDEHVFIALTISTNGDVDLTEDDVLFFEPQYQYMANGTNPPTGVNTNLPAQGPITNGVWQRWDGMKGGWYSRTTPPFNVGVRSLAEYTAMFPKARIVNGASGSGGVRLAAGLGLGTSQGFDGNADRFSLGTNGVSRTFDFERTLGLVCSASGGVFTNFMRTWTATDVSGNKQSCSQMISLKDTNNPFLNADQGPDITVSCPTAPPFLPGFPTATDGCSAATVFVVSDVTIPGLCQGSYTRTITWQARDACGNLSGTRSRTITVVDTNAPIVTSCPADTNLICPSAIVFGPAPTFMDACDPAVQVTFVETALVPTCPAVQRRQGVWTARDDCGNSVTCTQIVQVLDTTRPTIVANTAPPAFATVVCTVGGAIFGNPPTFTDTCDSTLTITTNDTVLVAGCPRVLQRTWTATDDCGNSTNFTQTVTNTDTLPPTVSCPGDFVLQCTTNPPALGAAVFTDCDPNLVIVNTTNLITSQITNTCPFTNVQMRFLRTARATDSCGLSSTCSWVVTIVDTTPPVLTNACPTNVTLFCSGSGTPAPFTLPMGNDNCDPNPQIICVPASPYPVGVNVVNCFAQDSCSNRSATCTFVVTVIDATPPVIMCPTNAVVECPIGTLTTPTTNQTGAATATDLCDTNLFITFVDTIPIETVGNLTNGWRLTNTFTGTFNFSNGPANPPLPNGSLSLKVGANGAGTAEARLTGYEGRLLTELTELGYWAYRDVGGSGGLNEDVLMLLDIDTDGNGSCDDIIIFEPEFNPAQQAVVSGVWQRWDALNGRWWSQNNPQVAARGSVQFLSVYIAAYPNAKICSATPLSGVRVQVGLAQGLWQGFEGFVDFVCVGTNAVTTCHNFERTAGNQCPVANILTRTWTATDHSGNRRSCSQAIISVNTAGPTYTGETNRTIPCGTSWSFIPPVPSEACGTVTNFAINTTVTNLTGQCSTNTLIAIRTWIAQDNCGNSSTFTQTVSVVDTNPPILICAPGRSIECGAPFTFDPPTASDNCSTVRVDVISTTTSAGPCGNTRSFTRVWQATDGCGNVSALCSQTISEIDSTPPIFITCPAPRSVECGNSWDFVTGTNAGQFIPFATDTCGAVPSVTFVSTATNTGPCGNRYTAVRTWRAIDSCGNVAFCNETVTIVDTTPPFLICAFNKTNACTDPWTFDPPFVFDTCGTATNVVVSTVTNVGTCGFVATRIWRGVDACGNASAPCAQVVTVTNSGAPTIVCAANKTVACGTSWDFDAPSASSACGTVTITNTATVTNAGPCGNTFTATRTWLATDNCSNSATCMQIVSVVDTNPPTITCVGNKTVECGTAWTFDAPSATDTCGTNTIVIVGTVTNSTGFCGNTFSATRTWRATDACGNSATCIQTVTVVDTTPPTITCVGNKTVQCGTAWTFDAPSATDSCGTNAIIIVSTVTNAGPCSLATIIATRTWQATDACGNTNRCTQVVTVTDSTPPVIGTITATQNQPGAGTVDVKNCTNTTAQGVVNIAVQASDSCGLAASPTVTLTNGTNIIVATLVNQSPVGTFNYTWTVTGATSNGTWTATVRVSDGCNTNSTTFTLCVEKSQITGQVELQLFVGTGTVPLHSRVVTFVATTNFVSGLTTNTTVLRTWVLTLTNVSGAIFNYALPGVPGLANGLSAKTDWNKRKKLPVVLDALGQGVANFTGANQVRGGDIAPSPRDNLVNFFDYQTLVTNWQTTNPQADMDGSGFVSGGDYNILSLNWFTVGDPE